MFPDKFEYYHLWPYSFYSIRYCARLFYICLVPLIDEKANLHYNLSRVPEILVPDVPDPVSGWISYLVRKGERISVLFGVKIQITRPQKMGFYVIIGYVIILLFDMAHFSKVGLDIPGEDEMNRTIIDVISMLLSGNVTYVLTLLAHVILVGIPFWEFSHSLLPDWIVESHLRGMRKRESLQHFIDANWRRARILTTLVLTGAIGTTLPFVFSRASPNFLFVIAIVGAVTVSPLAVVWFLMRRIREAEKALRPV